jgi:hypothetical protein
LKSRQAPEVLLPQPSRLVAEPVILYMTWKLSGFTDAGIKI